MTLSPTFWRLFNLRRDQDDPASIDADIRAGSQPVGANLWVLFFAILIASVGLNVNSTAVIVGAMLISPLMGPILAIGYGASVHDLKLIRESAKTLLIFATLSLVTSTLYFVLSPLDQPGSELLARTSPTLWDVLIAAFGGAAGMIAVTRKEISNVVPGVAIATALMPPLCTAGFGLAHGRWDLFGGAAYLFLINGVFIAAATLGIAKVLRLPKRGVLDEAAQRRHRIAIVLGITLVMAPSIWLGYRFVQHEVFQSGALRVAQEIQNNPQFNVVSQQVDSDARVLHLTLVGSFDEARLRDVATALLGQAGLSDARLDLRRAGDAPVDLNLLKNQLNQEVDKRLVQQLQVNDAKLTALEASVRDALAGQAEAQTKRPEVSASTLREEVHAQLPQVDAVTLAYGAKADDEATTKDDVAVVVIELTKSLKAQEKARLEQCLQVRLQRGELQLVEYLVARPKKTRG
jgi:uncharacterized hydrophobic protein (TIGR00271 family)